jgi:hypothetical protein
VKAAAHVLGCLIIMDWHWMRKEVYIDRAIGSALCRRELFPNGRPWQNATSERAKRSGIADCRRQFRRAHTAHRRLDYRVLDAEELQKIGASPHWITFSFPRRDYLN